MSHILKLHPPTADDQWDSQSKRLYSERAHVHAQLSRRLQAFDYLERLIPKLKKDFLETGVAHITYKLKSELAIAPFSFQYEALLRQLAKENNRYYIVAEDNTQNNYTDLHIPAYNRLTKLVASLNLMAQAIDDHSHYTRFHTKQQEPLVSYHSERKWNFRFSTFGEGKELLRAWIDQCHTDPVNRILLKLK